MDAQRKKVSVVGGGFSGLVVSYYLTRKGFQVTLYEKSDRLGGLLGSHQTSYGLIEQAANAFLANQDLENMSREIKVPLVEKKKTARRRYIFFRGRPRRWPLGLRSSLRVFIFVLRFLFARFSVRPRPQETMQAWGERHLGKAATGYLLAPAMQGIYAAQPSQLSANLLLRSLFSKKAVKGELRGSVAPMKGMQAWIDGLEKYLRQHKCEIRLNESIELSQLISTTAGAPVILATDLYSTQKILAPTPYHPGIHQIATQDLTSVTLQISQQSDRPPEGFGCLFPKPEGFNCLGVLYNTDIFPNRTDRCYSETWIFNQTMGDASAATKASFLNKILEDRKRLGAERSEVLQHRIFQWPNAIPLYSPSLEKIVIDLEREENNIFLMGNYLGQLGLSKLLQRAQGVAYRVKEKGKW